MAAKVTKAERERRRPAFAGGCSVAIDDDRPPLGIRVETSAAGALGRVVARRPTFLLPLHASVIACQMRGVPEGTLLDASAWLLVPAGQSVRVETRSPTATLLALCSHPVLARLVEDAYAGEVNPATMRRLLGSPYLAPRTIWVNEIAQRYAFERAVCEKRGNAATTFLEMEILKEWYFVRRDDEAKCAARRSHLEQDRPLFERAQRFIDAHLAEVITVSQLAKATHASPSAVLRAFHDSVGLAPATYIRARRLDEALLLLRSGRYAVSEVAARVGYESGAAFSQAFRARFGGPPSKFLRGASAR